MTAAEQETPRPADDFWRKDVLAAIADPTCTRDDVAVDYAAALLAYGPSGEWREINEAILARWSMSGLNYIKTQAWKLARGGAS
ncbi:MAG TPA: hypothetical protein VKA83_04995 [Methylomirabilota bacterium]|nr:hypothetical protein [Methylomirabilota bacterium]